MKTNKPEKIIVHHEAGNQGFAGVNQMHIEEWNFISSLGYGIGYQWYFDKDKGWKQGRAEDEEGAHTLGGWNRKSIGICFQGNYEIEDFEYNKELAEKIEDIRSRWGNLPVETHGENWDTKCPGKNLQKAIDEFRANQDKEVEDEPDNEIKEQNKVLWGIVQQLFEVISRLKDRINNKSC